MLKISVACRRNVFCRFFRVAKAGKLGLTVLFLKERKIVPTHGLTEPCDARAHSWLACSRLRHNSPCSPKLWATSICRAEFLLPRHDNEQENVSSLSRVSLFLTAKVGDLRQVRPWTRRFTDE